MNRNHERRLKALESATLAKGEVHMVIVPVWAADERGFVDAELQRRGVSPRAEDMVVVVRLIGKV